MVGYRLRSRLAGLERRVRKPGACPVCARPDGGLIRIVEREVEAEQPAPCPGCGRLPFTFTIRFGPDRENAL